MPEQSNVPDSDKQRQGDEIRFGEEIALTIFRQEGRPILLGPLTEILPPTKNSELVGAPADAAVFEVEKCERAIWSQVDIVAVEVAVANADA